jgi:tRNA1Val (adenine37-N6)-methyltransferase
VSAEEFTDGTLLGGRVRYRQRRDGHRTGIEPVLLAAAVPARPGEAVAEAGTGAGAGLLCLAARVRGVTCIGIEADAALAALARENCAANGITAVIRNEALPALATPLPPLDHAFANPPWFAPDDTPSPDARRRLARQGEDALHAWAAALARTLRRGGTLSLVVPARAHGEAASALLDAGCGAIVLHPLWPRAGRDAKLAILQGVRGSAAPARIAAGLVLHEGEGYSAEADAVLRQGSALKPAGGSPPDPMR